MVNPAKRRTIDFYALESRILLSGDSIDTAEAPDADAIATALLADMESESQTPGTSQNATAEEDHETSATAGLVATSDRPLEIIFVDAGVADADQLISDLRDTSLSESQRLVFELNADENGFDQISDALAPLSGVNAIHILSHGNGSGIQLGDAELNVKTSEAYAGQIASWGNSLDPDADMLIYGCDLAGSEDGRELLDSIASLCACDVAASNDPTGHSQLGGDWDLEFEVGQIETPVAVGEAAQDSWLSLLDNPTGSETTVANSSGSEAKPDVAVSSTGDFVVVWESDDNSGNGNDIYFRTYNADGTEQGNATRVNTTLAGDQNAPSVVIRPDGGFVVIWDGNGDQSGQSDSDGIFLQQYDSQGLAVGGETKVNSNNRVESDADIAMNADGNFVIAWTSNEEGSNTDAEIYLQRFDSSGTAQGSEIRANTTTAQNQFAPAVAMRSDGTFAIAWEGNGNQPGQSDAHGIYLQYFDASANLQGDEIRVNTTTTGIQSNADIEINADGTLMATWAGSGMIHYQLFDAAGNSMGSESTDTNNLLGPYASPNLATTNSGGFVIVYDGDESSAADDIYKSVIDSTGTRLSTTQVNTTDSDHDHAVVATANDGASIVVWQSAEESTGDDSILLQRYTDSSGPVITDGILLAANANYELPTLPSGTNSFDNQQIAKWNGESSSNITSPTFSNGTLIDALSSQPNGNLLLSVSSDTTIGSTLPVGKGDVFSYNPNTGETSLFLKGSLNANGTDSFGNTTSIFLSDDASPVPTAGDIDAFHLLSNGNILLSVAANAGMDDGSGNRLAIDNADIVLYDPVANAASILFDFDGIYTGDVNAITAHSSGLLTLSVGSNITLPSGDGFSRSDLFHFNHTSEVLDGLAPLEGRLSTNTPSGSFMNPGGGATTPNLYAAAWAAAAPTANFTVTEGTTAITQITAHTDHDQPLTFGISGGADAASFTIDSSTGQLVFVSPPDFESPSDADTDNHYEVMVFVEDVNSATDSQAITVQVTDIALGNVADIDTTPNEINENEPAGRTVGLTAAATGDVLAYSLINDDGGRFTIDPDTGVVTTATTLDREVDGETRQIEISATDGTNVTSATFNIAILPVNEHDPTIISGGGGDTASISIAETTTTVMSVVAIDADLPTQAITYSISGGEDATSFTIDPLSGLLEFNTAPDFEAPTDVDTDNIYTVEVTASDGDGRTDAQVLNVTVDDVAVSSAGQQTRTFSGSSVTLSHETTGDNRLMLVTVAIANQGSAVVSDVTYDNGSLSLAGVSVYSAGSTDEVRLETWSLVAPTLGTHDLVINLSSPATDGAIAAVLNLASVDQLNPLGNFVSAGDSSNTVSLTTSSSEDDMVLSTIGIEYHGNYDLVPGTNQLELWDLNSEGLNFGASRQSGGNSVSTTWTFDTTDTWSAAALPIHATVLTNTSPTITSNGGGHVASLSVDEWNTNAGPPPAGSTVTTITATDSDAGQSLSYTIVGGNDAPLFDLDATNGQLTFKTAPDRETPGDTNSDSLYELIVQVADGAGGSDVQFLNITVNDVNEYAITSVSDTDTANNELPENSVTGTMVGVTAFASDADHTATINYSLQDDAGGRFQIDSNTGVVSVADGTLLDRETASSHDLTVTAASSDGSQSLQTYTVTLTDVNESGIGNVTDVASEENVVQENALSGTSTGVTAEAIDLDSSDTVTYDLLDNAGGRFQVDPASGIVTVADGSLLDRESSASHDITLQATSSDGSQSSAIFTIELADQNEFAIGSITDVDLTDDAVSENAATGTLTGITSLANDADATATVSYALQNDAGGRFQIDTITGVVSVADGSLLDRETAGSHSLTVIATSSDGSQATQTYVVQVTDIDEFDVGQVTDSDADTNTVEENSVLGSFSGITANATDLDATTNNISYSLLDDDGGRFSIDQTSGSVFVAGNIDRETDGPVRQVTVRATSLDGSFTDQTFAITVTDIDEFDLGPISDAQPALNEVDENSTAGTFTGITASAVDADAENNTVTYSLDNTADGRFSIDPDTGLVMVENGLLLDRETASTHSIIVRAISSDGSQQTETFEIAINDVNEFNTTSTIDVDSAANLIDENVPLGTLVGITASASDADATQNTITYSLDDDDGGRFSVDASTGEITVSDVIDRESLEASSTIVIRSTSEDGSFTTASFVININDIDEFDVEPGIDTDPIPNAVDENSGNGAPVGLSVNAVDADSTAVVTYSLDDDAGGRFTIDSSTGTVTAIGNLDFETQSSHSITIRAASSDGSESTQSFAIQVQDVNEPPSATSDFFGKFKNADATAPGVLANDADVDGDQLSAVLVEGPSNGRLVLNGDGSFNYTADVGFVGIDTFRYQATDGILNSEPVLVRIEVMVPAPPDPVVSNKNASATVEPLIQSGGSSLIGVELAADANRDVPQAIQNKVAMPHLLEEDKSFHFDQVLDEVPRLELLADHSWTMSTKASDDPAQNARWEATMFRELLEVDIQQAVLWQDWDALLETTETPPILYVVGSAGSAAGIISVGYLLWILRGSTVITLLTSSAPRWRMVDPTAILTAYRGSIDYDEDQMEELLQ